MKRWRIVLLLIVVAGLWLAHRTILCGLACLLIVDQAPVGPDAVWITSADLPVLDAAAEICRESPGRNVLIVRGDPSRLEKAGILEPLETVARREPTKRGVLTETMEVIGPPVRNRREGLRRMAEWLAARPGATVVLPCSRFYSASLRQVLDDHLDPSEAARIAVVAPIGPRCDETNWWHGRVGIREFAFALLSRAYVRLGPDTALDREPWDPDQYEEELRERFKGKVE